MASAGPLNKLVRWLSGYDEDDDEMDLDDTTPPTAPGSARTPQSRPRRGPLMLQAREEGTMEIRHPRSLEDRMIIGMDLKQRRTVTLDLTRLPDADARYFLEFVYGVIFALDATAEKVTEGIYLLVPRGVPVHNDDGEDEQSPESWAAPRATARAGNDGQDDLFWHGG